MTHLKILTASAVAACLTVGAAPAMADTSGFTFAFRYDEADLANADGVARVHAALEMAAYKACQKTAPSAQRGVDHACRDELVSSVVQRIGNPQMAALEAGRDTLAR